MKAIIVRVDGALVETLDLEWRVLHSLLRELGYDWPCEREDFAAVARHATRNLRIEQFVRKKLKFAPVTDDVARLILAIQRRVTTLIGEQMSREPPKIRPGLRELITEARSEEIRIAAICGLDRDETHRMLSAALGPDHDSLIGTVSVCAETEDALAETYRSLPATLNTEPSSCLVVEATPSGLAAARKSALPAIVTRSTFAKNEHFDEALFVVNSLPEVLPTWNRGDPGLLSPDARAELVAALHRLHAGIFDLAGVTNRSSVMKVSEILKTKGQAVKTIGASETIWAAAQRLKAESIGALVVMKLDGPIEGIISERDLARALTEHGNTLPSKLVSDLMTKSVITCTPEDSVAGVSKIMTQRRIRHLPVVENGKIAGVISIGDVLNHRLDQMQQEVNILRDYAIAKS